MSDLTARCCQCTRPVQFIPPYLRHLRMLLCRKCVGAAHYAPPSGRIWVNTAEEAGESHLTATDGTV